MRQRYTWAEPVYDVLSAEWPVYRVAGRLGLPLLRLRPADTVLDFGCGTGLNFTFYRLPWDMAQWSVWTPARRCW
jgi:demethylmenaquinone methyltransferase/2-methoxy-6-polyprenyl-1,4-benzoquinol methylase